MLFQIVYSFVDLKKKSLAFIMVLLCAHLMLRYCSFFDRGTGEGMLTCNLTEEYLMNNIIKQIEI